MEADVVKGFKNYGTPESCWKYCDVVERYEEKYEAHGVYADTVDLTSPEYLKHIDLTDETDDEGGEDPAPEELYESDDEDDWF